MHEVHIQTWSELLTQIPPELKQSSAMYIAVLTDTFLCGRCDESACAALDFSKLLEIRVFDESAEYRAYRDYAAGSFYARVLSDDCGLKAFEEIHLLDQDKTKTQTLPNGKTRFYTMSGGFYDLPVGADTNRVKVRTYLRPSQENGIEVQADWRIVGFCAETRA